MKSFGDDAGGGGESATVAKPSDADWQQCIDNPTCWGIIALAMQIARRIDKKDHAVSLSCIADAQAESGDIDGAKETLQQIDDASDSEHVNRGDALTRIVAAQAKAGDINGAKETAGQIGYWGIRRVRALSSIAMAQAKTGDVNGAKETFSNAMRTAHDISDNPIHPNSGGALAEIAVAQAQIGDTNSAKQTFIDALRAVWRLDDSEYTFRTGLSDIITAQVRVGDMSGAKQVALHNFKDSSQRAEELGKIAIAQAKSGDISGAKQTIDRALVAVRQVDEVDNYSLDIIAEAQARTGDIDSAMQTAQQIREDEDDLQFDGALWGIIKIQAQAGDINGAKQTMQNFRGDSTDVGLEVIAVAQAQAGDISGAKETIQQVGDYYIRARALADIAKAQVQIYDVNGAKQTFADALDAVQNLDKNAGIMHHIAKAQAETGDYAEALKTAQKINLDDLQVIALTEIIKALAAR